MGRSQRVAEDQATVVVGTVTAGTTASANARPVHECNNAEKDRGYKPSAPGVGIITDGVTTAGQESRVLGSSPMAAARSWREEIPSLP